MEDINHQEDNTEIDNDNNDVNDDENINETGETEEDGEYEVVWERSFELNKDTLQRLKENDPSVTHLNIPLHCNDDGDCFFNSINWKEDGNCIVNNTYLKKVIITYDGQCLGRDWEQPYILGEQGHNLPTRQKLQDFFSCIHQSSSIIALSIDSISIDDEFAGNLIEGLCGLVQLEIGQEGGRVGRIGCKALGNVLKQPTSKLKNLSLSGSQLDDQGIGLLCDGLLGNSKLKKLDLDSNEEITSVGWRAFSTVLQHPKCNLIELNLYYTEINDDTAVILGTALVACTSLRALNLGFNTDISSARWQTLLDQLSQTAIESLELNNNMIDDDCLEALANIGTIKSVDLSSNDSITPEGWQSFLSSRRLRGMQLKKLDITSNSFDDLGTAALGRLLNSMGTLKKLNVSTVDVTSQGWVSLLTTLSQDTNLDLVELGLCANTIDDEGIYFLVPLVSSMRSLKYLYLRNNRRVTPTGWQALSEFFQSPNFALVDLALATNICINDDTIVSFASALVHNNTLKYLFLGECVDEEGDDMITERGWEAMSTLLCNKSTIMNIYNSNHTLLDLSGGRHDMDLPDELSSYLELNRNKDKAEVTRQKILQTLFSTDDDDASKIQELLDMELELMPTAIEWIGRPLPIGWEGVQISGLSTLYNLMRRLPDLFDSSPQKKPSMGKRKRGVFPNYA